MADQRSFEILCGPFFRTIKGRVGDYQIDHRPGHTKVEHRPRDAARPAPSEAKAALTELQRRVASAWYELDRASLDRWRAYAESKPRRVKRDGQWTTMVPPVYSVFQAAMMARWKADPAAPVLLDPFTP